MGDHFGMINGVGWLFWFSFIVLVLWLYTVLVNRNVKNSDSKESSTTNKTALEILEQRFLEGKVNEAEYKERKINLQKDVMPYLISCYSLYCSNQGYF